MILLYIEKKEVKHVSYWFSVLLFNQLLCLFSEITMAVPSLSACQICMCLVFLHLSYALNYHSIVVVHLLPLWGKFPFVTCIFQSQTYRFIFVVNVHLTYIKWTKTEKELCFIYIFLICYWLHTSEFYRCWATSHLVAICVPVENIILEIIYVITLCLCEFQLM